MTSDVVLKIITEIESGYNFGQDIYSYKSQPCDLSVPVIQAIKYLLKKWNLYIKLGSDYRDVDHRFNPYPSSLKKSYWNTNLTAPQVLANAFTQTVNAWATGNSAV
jgi:hypothetical protein